MMPYRPREPLKPGKVIGWWVLIIVAFFAISFAIKYYQWKVDSASESNPVVKEEKEKPPVSDEEYAEWFNDHSYSVFEVSKRLVEAQNMYYNEKEQDLDVWTKEYREAEKELGKLVDEAEELGNPINSEIESIHVKYTRYLISLNESCNLVYDMYIQENEEGIEHEFEYQRSTMKKYFTPILLEVETFFENEGLY